uniref:Protein kinase domain-containing protein n=1 Tax=Heterorhabditis bacteriophora TaxID=37862 RepID=A0A1I7X9V1_HETBA
MGNSLCCLRYRERKFGYSRRLEYLGGGAYGNVVTTTTSINNLKNSFRHTVN